MPLSPDQSDSVAKLMDLGVTLDQALLALVKRVVGLARGRGCLHRQRVLGGGEEAPYGNEVRALRLLDWGHFESVLHDLRSRAR